MKARIRNEIGVAGNYYFVLEVDGVWFRVSCAQYPRDLEEGDEDHDAMATFLNTICDKINQGEPT